MFETFGILLREGARVFQRSVESVAIRLFARTPPLVARVLRLGVASLSELDESYVRRAPALPAASPLLAAFPERAEDWPRASSPFARD